VQFDLVICSAVVCADFECDRIDDPAGAPMTRPAIYLSVLPSGRIWGISYGAEEL
jgi:hypothetical protein